jgi:dolichyl-diphosphooligosaccharide--protein glycosyltransferase
MLIYVAIKEKSDDKALFLVWSIIMLIAVLGQRRFGYYYAVNAALLTGYFSWKMLDIAGLGKLLAKSEEVVRMVKKSERKGKKIRQTGKAKTFMQPRGVWVRVIVVGIVILFLVFFPNIPVAKTLASLPNIVIDEGWYTSLLWLKDNSPEPFGDPDYYYELYPPKNEFKYPETAYGVMSWWDYGYFIMQIAHRIPNTNPGGQAVFARAGQFFTAQNESSANELADKLGSKYVMIDYAMASPAGFSLMAEWAGKSVDEFYERYYVETPGGGQWTYQFYLAYYNSIAVRLYNFDGKAVVPTESIVISYEEKVASGGEKYKEMTGWESFSSYEDAEAYVASQASGNYRIVGMSPLSSPVPLEVLNSYELVYPLETSTNTTSVKIFEHLGSGES